MTSRDLIDRASIMEVWRALGGGSLRHGRGAAWWRGGNGYNVALDESRSVFYDHARGVGGGVLDLVQVALGCDRRAALHWLADHQGVELDDQPPTYAERRQWAERRRRAEGLADWHRLVIRALRVRRNGLWDSERAVSRWARKHVNDPAMASDPRWERVWGHALNDQRGDLVERLLQVFEAAPAETLARLRANSALADVSTASLVELNALRTTLEEEHGI